MKKDGLVVLMVCFVICIAIGFTLNTMPSKLNEEITAMRDNSAGCEDVLPITYKSSFCLDNGILYKGIFEIPYDELRVKDYKDVNMALYEIQLP